LQSGASSIDQEKAVLRKRMRARLRALTADQKTAASQRICQFLLASDLIREARCVASFAGLASEPDLSALNSELLRLGKRLVFPRVIPTGLEFRTADGHESWPCAAHGPREPDPVQCAFVDAEEIDLVLVPGLAFASGGLRLGRGGGYYDRWLAGKPPGGRCIGVCFSCQIEPHLPVLEHDQRMDQIVTEMGNPS
jgi:5-formyltetrahydrofolate cyclo-ligase